MKMFDDVPDRKQAFLDDKNIHLTQSKNWIFPKELTHDFGQKFQFFFFLCYFGLKGHNGILHGRAEIWNLSFSVEKYFMSERS